MSLDPRIISLQKDRYASFQKDRLVLTGSSEGIYWSVGALDISKRGSNPPESALQQHREDEIHARTKFHLRSCLTDIPWLPFIPIFVINILTSWNYYSFSFYYVEICNSLGIPKSTGGLIGSLQATFSFFFSLLFSSPIQKYGCRRMTFVGTVLLSTGTALSSLAPSAPALYVTFGLLPGIGISIIYLVITIQSQEHFTRHRTLLTSLTYAAYSLGLMIAPPITVYLIEQYAWRGAMLIQSACMANILVLATTFSKHKSLSKLQDKGNRSNFTLNIEEPNNKSHEQAHGEADEEPGLTAPLNSGSRCLVHSNADEEPESTVQPTELSKLKHSKLKHDTCTCTSENDSDCDLSTRQDYICDLRRSSIDKARSTVDLETNATPIDTPFQNHRQKAATKFKEFLELLKAAFDFSLLCDVPFLLYNLATLLVRIASMAYIFHLASIMIHYGFSRRDASFVTTLISFVSGPMRPMVGIFGDLPCVSRYMMCFVGAVLNVVACLMVPLAPTYAGMATSCIIYGGHMALWNTLVPVILVDILGIENIGRAQAINFFFHGCSTVSGTPFAGWLFDVTQDYGIPFYVNTCISAIGAVLVLAIFFLDRTKQKNKASKMAAVISTNHRRRHNSI